jgi:hypothetical protein
VDKESPNIFIFIAQREQKGREGGHDSMITATVNFFRALSNYTEGHISFFRFHGAVGAPNQFCVLLANNATLGVHVA